MGHTETHLDTGRDLSDDYHIFGLEWTQDGIRTYLDNRSSTVLSVTFNESFFQRGSTSEDVCNERVDGNCTSMSHQGPGFLSNDTNPWKSGTIAAPFDKPFYLQINLAVGSTGH